MDKWSKMDEKSGRKKVDEKKVDEIVLRLITGKEKYAIT